MNLSIVKSYLKIHIKNSPIYSWFSGKGGGGTIEENAVLVSQRWSTIRSCLFQFAPFCARSPCSELEDRSQSKIIVDHSLPGYVST